MTREEAINDILPIKQNTERMDAEMRKQHPATGTVLDIPVGGEYHKVRFYSAGTGEAPIYFDIHGGGMVWGAMEDVQPFAETLQNNFYVHVCGLDYPLAIDTQYPDNLEYLYATVKEMLVCASKYKIDPNRVFIGGRSAGGNLAAALCILAVQRKEFTLSGLILDHPWLDMADVIPWNEKRFSGTPEAFALTKEMMDTFTLIYVDPDRTKEPCCTPLLASEEVLSKFPHTIIQTAELDSLEPEGAKFSQMLHDAGVPVTYHCFEKAMHGFSQGYFPLGEKGREWLAQAIREAGWLTPHE